MLRSVGARNHSLGRCGFPCLEDEDLLLVTPSELSVLEMSVLPILQLAFRKWAGEREPCGYLGKNIPVNEN